MTLREQAFRTAALGLLAAAFPQSRTDAQVSTVDEGSFTISRGSTRVGRESFLIRHNTGGGGDTYLSTATIDLDSRKLTPVLRTDSALVPLLYQLDIKQGDQIELSLKGAVGRGRFTAQVRTAKGESSREYLVADQTMLLDEGIFHQYALLAQRLGNSGGTVPVVVPQKNVQITLTAKVAEGEPLVIARTSIPTRHYVATAADGATREFWTDTRGRLLKVAIEPGGLTALRDQPPR